MSCRAAVFVFHPAASEKSADREDFHICCIFGDADAVLVIRGMDDAAVAHVDGYMSSVADDVAGLCIGQAAFYLSAAPADRGIIMRKLDSEVCVYRHDKTGAVGTFGQTAAAPFIGIADVLHCEIDNLLAHAYLGAVY